jgi:hypothetical protein
MAVDATFQKQDPNHPVAGAYVQPAPGITEPVVTLADKSGVTAFGPAGTESAAVQTIQGTASGTPVPVSGTGLGGGVAQGSTTASQVGTLVQGAVTTSAPTYTNAQTSPVSLTTAGGTRVDASGTTSAKAYRDSLVTVQAAAQATAPTAGTAVATVTTPPAGLYEVSGTLSISGTTVAAADSNNMQLKQGSTVKLTNIPIAVNSTTGTPGAVPFGPVILNLDGATSVTINAVANATGSSIYAAQLICRQVG